MFLRETGPHAIALISQTGRASTNVQALNACYTSAMEHLQIVGKDLASMSMLVRFSSDFATRCMSIGWFIHLAVRPGHYYCDDCLFCSCPAQGGTLA